MGRKHLLQKLGLSLILPLTITAAAYAQNNYPSNGTKPPPPAIQKMPPQIQGISRRLFQGFAQKPGELAHF
jgi:hypothetical protein